MAKRTTDKRFDFAERHTNGIFNTFTAASAIYRAKDLVAEATELKAWMDKFERLPSWRAPEFPSYYIVGLVTCLEWHARSRLYDLLQYDPANFTADDVKQAAAASNLEELLRRQITVAQLVAASTLVSDFPKYLVIFDRIFGYLGVTTNAADIVKAGSSDPGQPFVVFQALFERRHRLVHEINNTQVGHWNLRHPASLDEIEEVGHAVIGLMTRLEQKITAAAKGDFPNLIYTADYVSRNDILLGMITDTEDRMTRNILEAEVALLDVPGFEDSIRLSREHLESMSQTLRSMSYAGRKYYDLPGPLLTKLLETRLAFVVELEKQLHEGGIIRNPPTSPPAPPQPAQSAPE
jgi:hypothetical protein